MKKIFEHVGSVFRNYFNGDLEFPQMKMVFERLGFVFDVILRTIFNNPA
jgi:hypothetical protein